MDQQTVVNGIAVVLSHNQVVELNLKAKRGFGRLCGALEKTHGYMCTCEEGHDGNHIAHSGDFFPLAVWDASHNFGYAGREA